MVKKANKVKDKLPNNWSRNKLPSFSCALHINQVNKTNVGNKIYQWTEDKSRWRQRDSVKQREIQMDINRSSLFPCQVSKADRSRPLGRAGTGWPISSKRLPY